MLNLHKSGNVRATAKKLSTLTKTHYLISEHLRSIEVIRGFDTKLDKALSIIDTLPSTFQTANTAIFNSLKYEITLAHQVFHEGMPWKLMDLIELNEELNSIISR